METKIIFVTHLDMTNKIPIWVDELKVFEEKGVIWYKPDYHHFAERYQIEPDKMTIPLSPDTKVYIATFDKDKIEQYKIDLINKAIEMATKRFEREQKLFNEELKILKEYQNEK